MLAPALGYVILLVGVPFVLAIALSFSNATAGSLSFQWAGLGNYVAILGDSIFLRALRNSVVVTVGTQVLVIILATAAAQVFRATFRDKRVARFVLLLPWAVPVSLAAIAWTWIFDSTFSVINWTLKAAGLLHGWLYWLGDPPLALIAIIIVQAWRIFPFATVIVLAGLTSIPPELLEAAIIDGAGCWRRLSLLLDARHRLQAEPGPVRGRHRSQPCPVDLQRPAHAGSPATAAGAYRLSPLGHQHPAGHGGGGSDHRRGGGAGGLQPGPA